ncbi:serine hydrolase domain-containing protein [candidate division KSB1 bacterium]
MITVQKNMEVFETKKHLIILNGICLLLIVFSFACSSIHNKYSDKPAVQSGKQKKTTQSEPVIKIPDTITSALKELESIVNGFVEEDLIVGAELLVIKERRTVLHKGFGWKDREKQKRLESNTIFNIRSMTKMLTGAAIQILVDKGELDIKAPVSEYIPGFDNERSKRITIEQLLTHRSGLLLSLFLEGSKMEDFENLTAVANAVGERGPQFEPGSKFWYSDSGTDVLGAVIERVTGKTLDVFIREHFLVPLGMKNSFYLHDFDGSKLEHISSLYMGFPGSWSKIWEPGNKAFYPYAVGSQSLFCTPEDFAQFLMMLTDNGMYGDKQILSEEAVTRMLTPFSEMTSLGSDMPYPTSFPDLKAHYGQTAIVYTSSGITGKPEVFGHSGSDGTYAWVWPDLDLIILYFTQSRGSTTGIRLETEIDRLLIHPDKYKPTVDLEEKFGEYLGTYVANFDIYRNREFTVLIQNGNLAVDIPGQLVFELKDPDNEGKRNFAMTDQVAVSFEKDSTGIVTGMKLHQAGIEFKLPKGKALPETELDLGLVKKYLGFYFDEEVNNDIEVKLQKNRLVIDIPGVKVFELYPPDENGFWEFRFDPRLRVHFDEDENGNVISLTRSRGSKKRVCPKVR